MARQICVAPSITYWPEFSSDPVRKPLAVGHFSLVGHDDKIACSYYPTALEVKEAIGNQELRTTMAAGANLKRFCVFMGCTWGELAKLKSFNDHEIGGVAAYVLQSMNATGIRVIPAPNDTAFGMIERYFDGEDFWIGDISRLPFPPLVNLCQAGPQGFTLRYLDQLVHLEQLKLIDFLLAKRYDGGFSNKLAKLTTEHSYLACLYERQGLDEDAVAVKELEEFCKENRIYFHAPSAQSLCPKARRGILSKIWRDFLADIAKKFPD